MRSPGPFAAFVLLFLASPACDSKKAVVSPRDGSNPLDLGMEANADSGSSIPRDVATERNTPGDTLTADSPDTSADALAMGDGPANIDLQSLDAGSGEAGTACVAGAACSGQTSCSFGDEVDLWCRSMLVCQSGTLRAPSRTFTTCGATAGSPCPATQPAQGAACTTRSQTCSYTTGTCTCATGCEAGIDAGPCQRPKTWYCDGQPPAGCPTQAPQLGAPCATGKAICSYGRYCYQYQVTCTSGHWEPYTWGAFGGCA